MRDDDDDYLVHMLGGGGTHLLASLAEANCLVLVDEDTTEIPVGSEVAGVVPGAAGLTVLIRGGSGRVGIPAGRRPSDRWPPAPGRSRFDRCTARTGPMARAADRRRGS